MVQLAEHDGLSRTFALLPDLFEPDEALPVACEVEAEPVTPLMAGLEGGAGSG